MLRRWVRFLVFCFLGLLVLAVFASHGFVVWGFTRDDATVRMGEAEDALRGAFAVVSEAEGAGANVSAVLVGLGWAGGNLTLAEGAFQSGDYAGAVAAADVCSALAGAAAGEADGLRVNAVAAAGLWWQTVAFSVVGACAFGVVLVLLWRWFRRVYGRRVLAARPEVVG